MIRQIGAEIVRFGEDGLYAAFISETERVLKISLDFGATVRRKRTDSVNDRLRVLLHVTTQIDPDWKFSCIEVLLHPRVGKSRDAFLEGELPSHD
ncbi:MAG: hypothetical protein M5R36_08515 [Deltaproteobacteria bacterium]|nr:hypothetical protein [Deltaproteobacteria bacterium]